MYWPDKKVMTIDIPKTACVTRWRIGYTMHGQRRVPGHVQMSRAIIELEEIGIDYRDIEFWAIIRNPEKRLLSSCNYHFRQVHRWAAEAPDITSYLKEVHESKYFNGTVFKPQSWWLDVDDIDVKLWPMEHYDDMLRALGWDDTIGHENESTKFWTLDDLRNSRYYPIFMEKYADDQNLYSKALANFQ